MLKKPIWSTIETTLFYYSGDSTTGQVWFLLQDFMNIDGMTLILIFLFPRLSAGPHKPQTLTASKTKYEKFGPKNLDSSLKIGIFVP